MPIDNRYHSPHYPSPHPAPRPPHRIPGAVRALLYLLGRRRGHLGRVLRVVVFELSRPGVHFG